MGLEKDTRCSTTEQSFVVTAPTAEGEAVDAAEEDANAVGDAVAAIAELQYSKMS